MTSARSASASSRINELVQLLLPKTSSTEGTAKANDWLSTLESKFESLLNKTIDKNDLDSMLLERPPLERLEFILEIFEKRSDRLRTHQDRERSLRDRMDSARKEVLGEIVQPSKSLVDHLESFLRDSEYFATGSEERGASNVYSDMVKSLDAPSRSIAIRLDRSQTPRQQVVQFFSSLSLYLKSQKELEELLESRLMSSAAELSLHPYTSGHSIEDRLEAYTEEVKNESRKNQLRDSSILSTIAASKSRLGLKYGSSKYLSNEVDYYIIRVEDLYKGEKTGRTELAETIGSSVTKAAKAARLSINTSSPLQSQVKSYFNQSAEALRSTEERTKEFVSLMVEAVDDLGLPDRMNVDDPVDKRLKKFSDDVTMRIKSGSDGAPAGSSTATEGNLKASHIKAINDLGVGIFSGALRLHQLQPLDRHSELVRFELHTESHDARTASKNLKLIQTWFQQYCDKTGGLLHERLRETDLLFKITETLHNTLKESQETARTFQIQQRDNR